ncbi:MAG: TetR/AcrR family transcriptional regulator [Eubacteriales bacterium]|nr:TetR/AcrR family transcriptional regulator [Eubacteriales bacterium]
MAKHREDTNRKLNAKKTKNVIYKATLDLINEKGYENVSISDITKRAECATGTFYLHFKSKSDVMAYCVEQYNQVAVEAYEIAKEKENFADRVITFIVEDYKRTELLGKGAIRAIYATNIMQSYLVMNKSERVVYNVLLELFQYGIDTGALHKDTDVVECTRSMGRSLMGVDLEWSCMEEDIDIVSYATQAAKRILYGYI